LASRNMEAYLRMSRRAEFADDLTSDKSFSAITDFASPTVEIHEPPSLPQGGLHKGLEAWENMHHVMRDLWDQKVEPVHVWDVPEDDVIVLYTMMEWTAKPTGKSIRFPAVEILRFEDAKLVKVEIFHQDSKAVLDTLERS
jgi:hypothetical protein